MLAIKNFGHFWSRDKVFWGKPKIEGHLKGELRSNKRVEINFREQIGIYALFNFNREIVYIGEAGIGNKRPFGRLKDHRSDHLRDRWVYFSWFGLRDFNENTGDLWGHDKPETWIRKKRNKDALNETESVLIQLIEPPLNKQGSKWTGTKEFLQHVDDRIPSEPAEMLHDMDGRLRKMEKILDRYTRQS
jgi:hypothetical protein